MAIRGRRFQFFQFKFKIQTPNRRVGWLKKLRAQNPKFSDFCVVCIFLFSRRYWRFFHESPGRFCQVQRLVGAYEKCPCNVIFISPDLEDFSDIPEFKFLLKISQSLKAIIDILFYGFYDHFMSCCFEVSSNLISDHFHQTIRA